MREWRRRLLRTVGLLLVTLAACAIGLAALDASGQPLPAKLFRGMWNALNLVTTLGDLTGLDQREKVFMMATMVAFLVIGGYAVSSLTGIFSSDAVLAFRENRKMEHELDRLANHVIVVGFAGLAALGAGCAAWAFTLAPASTPRARASVGAMSQGRRITEPFRTRTSCSPPAPRPC